jgi:protein-tyrosine phosphatase
MEIDRYGPCPLDDAELCRHRVSFLDETLRPDLPSDGSWTLDELYAFLMRRAGDRIASVLMILSDDDAYPAVFHCTAGKDRTGVVAALVLSLLGVCDDDVADDYAFTAEVMPTFTERVRSFLERTGAEPPQFTEHVLRADRESMLLLLDAVRYDHGSIDAWALSHGMSRAALRSLRANLLETP